MSQVVLKSSPVIQQISFADSLSFKPQVQEIKKVAAIADLQMYAVRTKLWTDNESVWGKIRRDLSYDTFQDGRFQVGYAIDGNGWFGTGLVPRVYNSLKEMGIEPQITNHIPQYSRNVLSTFERNPRDFQEEGANSFIRNRYSLLRAPVRTGKTTTIALAFHKLSLDKVLFVCSSEENYEQAMDTFNDILDGFVVGGLKASVRQIDCDIVVAMRQTIASWLKDDEENAAMWLASRKVLCLDECHEGAGDQIQKIAEFCSGTSYRMGMSATPLDRGDGLNIFTESAFGPIGYEVSYTYAIDQGFIVPPKFLVFDVSPRYFDEKGYNGMVGRRKLYQKVEKEYIVENQERNQVVADFCAWRNRAGFPVLVLVDTILHGEILQKKIPDAEFIQGTTPDRKLQWKRFIDGKIPVVISTVANQAVDLPPIQNIFLAAGGKSPILAFQRQRGLTAYSGKTECLVGYFYDRALFLEDHSEANLKLWSKEPRFKIELIADPISFFKEVTK